MKVFKTCLTLLSIVITVTFLYFEKHLSLPFIGIALLFYFLSSAIHLLAHECGHFIGGIVSGYELLCLQLGPLNIVCKNNKPSLVWKCSLSGQCIMIPKQISSVHFKAYNIGGVLANALIVILSFTLLLINSFLAYLLFIELVCVGIQKILVNAIPHKTKSIPNDGYIVKLLNGNIAVQKDYAVYLRLYGKLFFDEDVTVQDFIYEREVSEDENEMLYYNEIQNIISSMNSANEKMDDNQGVSQRFS